MNKLDRLRTNRGGMAIWTACSVIMINCMIERKKFFEIDMIQRIALAIMAVVLTLIFHEIIHAVVASILTRKPVVIKVVHVNGHGYVPMTSYHSDNLKLWKLITIHITPFLLLTVGLILVNPIITNYKLAFVAYVIALGNCAGCYKDIMDCIYHMGIKGKKRM